MSKFSEIKKDIAGSIWTSDESYRNLLALCSFGNRFGWTSSEIEARDYILKKLRKYGLENVHREEFEYLGWRTSMPREDKAWITEPNRKEIEALSFFYSPSTPPEGVEGEVVFVDYATSNQFAKYKDPINGKMLLSDLSNVWPYGPIDATNRAAEYGAMSLMMMSRSVGCLPMTDECQINRPSKIPVVGISREDGEYIKRLLAKGKVKVAICLRNEMGRAKSWNVVAEIKGKESPEEQVIVGAHFDSPGPGVGDGAIDGASGTSVVMEVARTLAKHKGGFKRTIKFICWPLEELGSIGSFTYAAEHGEELSNAIFYLSLDGAGLPGARMLDISNTALTPYLRNIVNELGYHEMEIAMEYFKYSLNYGDEFPFILKGIPTTWLKPSWKGYAYGDTYIRPIYAHTKADTVDKVDHKTLRETAMIATYIVASIADVEKPHVKNRTKEEVLKILEEYNYVEYMKVQGRWPPPIEP